MKLEKILQKFKVIRIMSKLKYLTFLFFLFFTVAKTNQVLAQCSGKNGLTEYCDMKVPNYQHHKCLDFYLPGKADTEELVFTINMTKGVIYQFQMIGNEDENPIMSIFARNFKVATNFNEKNGKLYETIEFVSRATTPVEIRVKINNKKNKGCGVIVMRVKQ